MRYIVYLISASLMLFFLPSCGKNSNFAAMSEESDPIQLSYAEELILEQTDSYVKATVRNPWDTTRTLHTYILIPDSVEIPSSLPAGTVVRTPLKNALVYSTVHQSLIDELGAQPAIGGICDAQYIRNPRLLRQISDGQVSDCGNSYTPNLEKIIQLHPDAILLSPYENSGNYGKIGQLGIPIIECADYMESSPLGRAEWMKFYGLLFGVADKADSLFNDISDEYLGLKSLSADTDSHPGVIIDRLYGNTWYVPRANSTMGTYIIDAGGTNPFRHIPGAGSAGLSGEQVLHEGGDADFWLVRYSQSADKTLNELKDDNVIYTMFDAYKNARVFGCNTQIVDYYEQTPFHPHWLLRDIMLVIHPELFDSTETTRYFTPLTER